MIFSSSCTPHLSYCPSPSSTFANRLQHFKIVTSLFNRDQKWINTPINHGLTCQALNIIKGSDQHTTNPVCNFTPWPEIVI